MIFPRLLKSSLALFILATAAVLLIRSQPYHQGDLEVFLTPTDDCPAPCFLGIRPGVTTAEEAYTLLYNSGWTDELVFHGEFYSLPMTWNWSSSAPAIFQPTGRFYDGSLRISNNIVQHIELKTQIDFGDAVLNWGNPDSYTLLATTGGPVGEPPPPRPFVFVYPDMAVLVPTQCIYLRRLWKTDSTLIIGDPVTWLANYIPLDPSPFDQPMMRFVADINWHFCHRL